MRNLREDRRQTRRQKLSAFLTGQISQFGLTIHVIAADACLSLESVNPHKNSFDPRCTRLTALTVPSPGWFEPFIISVTRVS